MLKKGTTLVAGNTVTIDAGQSYVDVTLEVVNDTTPESTETASLTLATGSGYTVGSPGTGNISITDDEVVVPAVTVSATDNAAGEPSNNGTYRISRTGSTTSALTVNFTVSGDATRGSTGDYELKKDTTLVSGNTVTIDAGQSYVDVTLEIVNDTTPESTETASLTLASGTGYAVGTTTPQYITITDDDPATPTLSISPTMLPHPEGNPGQLTPFDFTVTLSANPTSTVTVEVNTADGTATAAAADAYFGYSAAVSGSTIVVGAYQDDTGANDTGSALRLRRCQRQPAPDLEQPHPGCW